MSSDEKVVPTEHDLKGINVSDPKTAELIRSAEQSDAADRKLSVRAALGKYRKAVFWGMYMSLALVMEGFDGNMVCPAIKPSSGDGVLPPIQAALTYK